MSQEQYNALLSNLLKEKRALAKLRVELEGRKRKLCRSCKRFRHLAQNCRNKRKEGKGAEVPQNKFEILKSQVMQCGVEERIVRSIRMEAVRCFKCGKEGHKCRECPLWVKKEKVARVATPQKAQQKERPARPVRGKAQEGERRLRRVEGGEAACVAKPREVQREEWKRSSWEVLRKRAEWYYGPTVPQDAELWELGWCGQGAIVTYLKCPRCGKEGCYAEDDRGQGTLSYWKREKISWCGCKAKRAESSVLTGRKSTAKVERVARPREAKAQQSGTQSGEPESAAKEGGSRKEVKSVTNFIRSYLHQFFDDSHGLKASLKPLRRPFDRCQSRLEAINNGRDIKQINW